jgi:predicted nucleic acid-binding protein
VSAAVIADTGGLLRALARRPDGEPTWPDYEETLRRARAVVIPTLVLAEVDYFLRDERAAMRKLIAEIFDPKTTFEMASAPDIVRALEIDGKFRDLRLGFVDGIVAAVAERRKIYRVLTSDRRDFAALRIGQRYDRALTLVP